MKTVPVTLGQGGPVIGTCTIDDKNKTISIEYDRDVIEDKMFPGMSMLFSYKENETKFKHIHVIDVSIKPDCAICEMKAIKEKDVDSIEIKL